MVSESDKRRALEQAFLYLSQKQPFYGGLLQELTIKYSSQVPTAGVMFDEKNESFNIIVNPDYFVNHLDIDLKVNVLHHEILHFTNKHMFRVPWFKGTNEEKTVMNIAGDAAINQYLYKTAKGCPTCPHKTMEEYEASKCPGKWIDIKDFKMDDGTPFPAHKDIETYYELLQSEKQKQKGNKKTKGNVNEQLDKYVPQDSHEWEKLDEATKEKMINEARKILKRSIEKTQFNHSIVPDSIKDFLTELEVLSVSLDYKRILQDSIKRTVSSSDRENTWTRPNRRYGNIAPGSKLGALPQLTIYQDHSGSISVTEQNIGFRIIDKFLEVGSRKCNLGFWHTELYYKKPYKKGFIITEQLESGGTDIECVMKDILDSKPDLALVLTDGYYDKSISEPKTEVIFIISEGGNKDHPMKHIGKTIMLENLKSIV